MKVALVYDRINKWGGAERVLLALHEMFPKAPLFTSVYNPATAAWAEVFDIKTSFLQKFPKASSSHEFYPLFMPLAFESFNFNDYELVISVTSEAAKGVITKPKTFHVCYCLTPTRYLWSGYEDYFNNKALKYFSKPLISYLKKWDLVASSRPDAMIAISKEVKKRIKKFYGRESLLVYPGINLGSKKTKKGKDGDYFLIVSRFVPYKKIDIAIKAFNKMGIPLKIIGKGVMGKYLKRIASSNIEFFENLTDEELLEYYIGCRALIFPAKEDFGLAIIEAQQLGKPVIAFKGGGALESVIKDKTGIFFENQSERAIIEAVEKFSKMKFSPVSCIRQAEKFSKDRFKREFLETVEVLLKNFRKRS